jgi:hypothetical protein
MDYQLSVKHDSFFFFFSVFFKYLINPQSIPAKSFANNVDCWALAFEKDRK